MANNRSQTARKNLDKRRADFDNTIAGSNNARAFRRPGSQNSKKQGAGGDSGGKRR